MTARKPLGVGVLGYGFMGKTHTFAHKAMGFYYDPPPVDCRLLAVCEATGAQAEAARVAGGFARATTDPADVIDDPDVGLVHVCTPNAEHLSALRAAIAAGKHIYVDKPVTASLAEADELEALLAGYRGKAQVALQYRFFPATIRARQLVAEGFLGPVTHFRAAYLHSGSVDPAKAVNWKSTAAGGGGVIRDLGSHVLDLLWWLTGPFRRVHCTGRIWAPRRPSADRPGTMMAIDAEEAAVMILQADDGAFGTVDVSKIATGAEDELRFEIHGRWGAMRFNLMQPNYLEVYDARAADGDFGGQRGWQRLACVQKYPAPGGTFPNPKFALGWIRSHVHSLYALLRAIADDLPASGRKAGADLPTCGKQAGPSPSLSEGVHRQRVLEAVRDAAEKQTWVDLPQPA